MPILPDTPLTARKTVSLPSVSACYLPRLFLSLTGNPPAGPVLFCMHLYSVPLPQLNSGECGHVGVAPGEISVVSSLPRFLSNKS